MFHWLLVDSVIVKAKSIWLNENTELTKQFSKQYAIRSMFSNFLIVIKENLDVKGEGEDSRIPRSEI